MLRRTSLSLLAAAALSASAVALVDEDLERLRRALEAAKVTATEEAAEARFARQAAARAARRAEKEQAEAVAAEQARIEAQAAYDEALAGGSDPDPGGWSDLRERPFDVHDAADRTAEQNKAAYLPPMRATRRDGPRREAITGSLKYGPGDVPDLGDLDVYGYWKDCLGVSKGRYTLPDDWQSWPNEDLIGMAEKNGHMDIARCSFQPHPTWKSDDGSWAAANHMNWGFRRYNLGDSTVVDCDFSNIPIEHGIYDGVAAHALYLRSTFLDLGGQAIQAIHREFPKDQYTPGALAYTGRPSVFVEQCHAVDVGRHARRRSFAWTFGDVGSFSHPGTVVLRDTTLVSAWAVALQSNSNTPADGSSARPIRSAKGLVATQYQHAATEPGTYALEAVVFDNALFDMTQADGPIISIRGCETIFVHHSTFVARDCRQPQFHVDDGSGGGSNPSGTLILQDCVSPEGARVWLRVANAAVMLDGDPVSLHCPGERIVVDVATRTARREPMADGKHLHLVSPLAGRAEAVRTGVNPQPAGAVLDMGTVDLVAPARPR